MNPKEFLKINGIDVGLGSHSIEDTVYSDPNALTSEVLVRKGKLRINLVTPSLELTEALHNGMLEEPAHERLEAYKKNGATVFPWDTGKRKDPRPFINSELCL